MPKKSPNTDRTSGAKRTKALTRAFVPLNREDALQLLSGVGIVRTPFGRFSAAPQIDSRIPTIGDGLRRAEIELLAGGLKARFPLLVELSPADWTRRAYVPWTDIRGLVFRTGEEAEEFKFRPVAEFDAAALPETVDPSLFGIDGDARFAAVREFEAADATRKVDTIAGGLACVLELLRTRPPTFAASAAFLGALRDESSPATLVAISRLLNGEPTTLPRDVRAVVQAFATPGAQMGRTILEDVFVALREEPTSDEDANAERKWLDFAAAVFENRRELSGRILSDDKRVGLKAALLAARTRDVGAVASFADLDPPAGAQVLVFASFLIGLNRGLSALSWQTKERSAEALSRFQDRLLSGDGRNVRFELRISDHLERLAIDDLTLAERDAPVRPARSEAEAGAAAQSEDSLTNAAAKAGLASVAGADPECAAPWKEFALADGRRVLACAMDAAWGPIMCLRRRLDAPRSATKPASLAALNAEAGLLWRVALDDEGAFAAIDLPMGNLPEAASTLWEALARIEQRFAPRKGTRRPTKRKSVASKSADPQLPLDTPVKR